MDGEPVSDIAFWDRRSSKAPAQISERTWSFNHDVQTTRHSGDTFRNLGLRVRFAGLHSGRAESAFRSKTASTSSSILSHSIEDAT